MGVEVCPVHKAEFKSSQISGIHVVAMSFPSQPRGLKRKHQEDSEDEDPGPYHRRSPRYVQERRALLDLTYDKLKRTQAEKNPSFLRQVLMTNVVRSLREGMERDGIHVNGLTRESVAPIWSTDNNQVSDLDPPPNTNVDIFSLSYANASNGPDHRPATPAVINSLCSEYSNLNTAATPNSSVRTTSYNSEQFASYSSEQFRCLMDIDISPKVCPTPARNAEFGALWSEDHDRLSSLNWSSVLKSSSFDVHGTDCVMSEDASSGTSLHTLMPAVTCGIESYLSGSSLYSASSSSSSPAVGSLSGNTSPGSGSSPSSSEDEIFGDVDLTLYDYDYTPLSPPNVATAPLSAEELLWSLSNDQKQGDSDDRDYLASVLT